MHTSFYKIYSMDSIVQDCSHGDLEIKNLNLKDEITEMRNGIVDISNVLRCAFSDSINHSSDRLIDIIKKTWDVKILHAPCEWFYVKPGCFYQKSWMHLIIAIALFSAEKLLCCNTNWGKVLVNGIRLKKTWNFRFDSGLVYAFCYIFLNSVNCVTTSSYWVTTSLCWYKWKLCPHMKMCCALVYKSYIIFTKCFNCIFLFLSRCLSSTIFSYDITIISANVFMSSSSGKDFFFFFSQ